METTKRRAYLATMVEKAESDMIRLKALDLLQRLDEREPPVPPKPPEPVRDLEEQWATQIDLIIELGFCNEAIEARAQEIAAERLRSEFGIVGEEGDEEAVEEEAAPEAEPVDEAEVSPDPPEADNEPQIAPDPHSPEVLARQWPGHWRRPSDLGFAGHPPRGSHSRCF